MNSMRFNHKYNAQTDTNPLKTNDNMNLLDTATTSLHYFEKKINFLLPHQF